MSAVLLTSELYAQKDKTVPEDTRTKNRRIADSLYYVHTIKPQQDSIKQQAIKQLGKEGAQTTQSKARPLNLRFTSDTSANQIADKDIPSATLYQNTWVSERVKSGTVTMKDLPDEVTLRLCGKKGDEKFCFPYKGIKTSGYGWRWGRPHTGLDIALNTGDKIYAAFDGVVRVAKFNGGYGNMVLIRHYNNLETLYGHMSEIKVKPGQKVKAGDVIGLGGSTGRSTGPHLHFECRLLYACIDPEWIVDMRTYQLKSKMIRIDKSYFGIPASQTIAEQKNIPSKLTKVHTLLDGTKYVSEKELNSMIYKKETQKLQPAKINNSDKSTWRYYRVQQGDTVDSLSEKFNITKKDLISINGLDKKELQVGERIRVR